MRKRQSSGHKISDPALGATQVDSSAQWHFTQFLMWLSVVTTSHGCEGGDIMQKTPRQV